MPVLCQKVHHIVHERTHDQCTLVHWEASIKSGKWKDTLDPTVVPASATPHIDDVGTGGGERKSDWEYGERLDIGLD